MRRARALPTLRPVAVREIEAGLAIAIVEAFVDRSEDSSRTGIRENLSKEKQCRLFEVGGIRRGKRREKIERAVTLVML